IPYKHVFQYLDGETTGPCTYSGPIGKTLANFRSLPVTNFKSVYCDLPVVAAKDLSKDRNYLLDISNAVSTGVCSFDLSRRDPGPTSHARRLTTANIILRLYVGTEEPSSELIQLVHYIMRVYCITWFSIKMNHSCTSGSKLLCNLIKNSRFLSDDLKKVVDPVISLERSCCSPDYQGKRIFFLDNRRRFVVPKLNFKANQYIDMIDWFKCDVAEPSITADLTVEELKSIAENGSIKDIQIYKFPCHTRSVERYEKIVTETASTVC
ncbi:hypothetical protein AVEN_199727-1, partial [Araneus ventricosus]